MTKVQNFNLLPRYNYRIIWLSLKISFFKGKVVMCDHRYHKSNGSNFELYIRITDLYVSKKGIDLSNSIVKCSWKTWANKSSYNKP